MKKKSILSILVIAMVSVLMVGATMSWFTDDNSSNPVTNNFTTGTVKISADNKDGQLITTDLAENHWNPGEEKTLPLEIKNTGSKSIYLRFKLDYTWNSTEKVLPISNVLVTVPGWIFKDGYYYYKGVIGGKLEDTDKPTSINTDLKVKIDGAATNNDYQGKTLQTKITVEAVQSSNGAALATWNVDPSTL